MRRAVQRVEQTLRAFLDQRDDVALVAPIATPQTLLLLHLLKGIQESGTTLHWTSADAFADPRSYVDAIVAASAQRRASIQPLLEKEGEPSWPAMPPELADRRLSPVDRLRGLMAWSHRIDQEFGPTAWVLCPLEIHDAAAYQTFIAALLDHDPIDPWCSGLRIIVRDTPDAPLAAIATALTDVRVYAPDLSHEALEASLLEEADDDHAPIAERMQALLQLAALDYSHRRHADAAEKYALLLRYHSGRGDAVGAAMALNGLGEVHAATGRTDEAYARFQDALDVALGASCMTVALPVVVNAANLALSLEDWPRADETCEALSALAGKMCNAEVKLLALENQGRARFAMGNARGAYESWNAALTVARAIRDRGAQRSALERLRGLYQHARMHDAVRSVDAETARLDRAEGVAQP